MNSNVINMRFGKRVPVEYMDALQKLEDAKENLEKSKKKHSVTPESFGIINEAKAKLYDIMMADGVIVIGKINSI